MKPLRPIVLCLLLAGCTDLPAPLVPGTTTVGDGAPAPAPSEAPPLQRRTLPTSQDTSPPPEVTPLPDAAPVATPRPRVTPRPTPTPRPSTAVSTAPTPTPTPKPSATATPTPAPVVNTTEAVTLSGTGPSKTASFSLGQGKVAFQLSHTGSGNFVVWLINSNGRRFMLLANKLGNYSGTTTVTIEHAGSFSLEVEHGNSWSVSVGPG